MRSSARASGASRGTCTWVSSRASAASRGICTSRVDIASLSRARRATNQLRHVQRDSARQHRAARVVFSSASSSHEGAHTGPMAASRPLRVRTARSATRVADTSPAASWDSTCPRSHAVLPLSEGSTANGRHNCKDGVACRPHAQEPGLPRDGAVRLASCVAPRRCSPRSATTSGSHSSIASARGDRCPPCA
jgi:hypothetical protein